MSEWIRVEDQKPSRQTLCVTRFKEEGGGGNHLLEHYGVGRGVVSYGRRTATHWIEVPELPEVTE